MAKSPNIKNSTPVSNPSKSTAGFNIANFKADLDKDGILKTSQGQLIFSSPRILQSSYPDAEKVMLRADRFSIPGIWLTQDDGVHRYGYGPVDKTPHLAMFDPFYVEFIADKNGFIPDYMTRWIRGIINFNSDDGMIDVNYQGARAYEHSYKSDYLVDLYVRVYREDTQKVLTYKLSKAWPQALPGSQIDWSDQNSIIKFPVVFQYKEWTLVRTDAPNEAGIQYMNNAQILNGSQSNLMDNFLRNSIGVPSASIKSIANTIRGIL